MRQRFENHPAKRWQSSAPATVIERPQISIFRKRSRAAAASLTAATHKAPTVDSGETSTRADPTLMLSATASGSPPPTCVTSPGAVGRKVGRTTPEVLLALEI